MAPSAVYPEDYNVVDTTLVSRMNYHTSLTHIGRREDRFWNFQKSVVPVYCIADFAEPTEPLFGPKYVH